jgi:outer membrane protein OmpA-like peptidoglycan-associated protein
MRPLLAVLACLAGLGAILPAAASASHEQGGSISASVTAGGRLQGTFDYLTRGSCVVGTSTGAYPITIRNPLGSTAVANTNVGRYVRCVPNSTTVRASFDVDLATAFNGDAPDGEYLVTFSTCCRVGGIINGSTTDTTFRAQVRKTSGRSSSSPVMTSEVPAGVAKGYAYSEFLNASDPDGEALTYTSRAGHADGPATDVILLSAAGEVSIPAATTATFTNNQFYVYKVRVIDTQGEFGERDVLLRVTANNAPPAVTGLDGSTPYRVTAGTTRQVTFGAADPNNASPKVDTVTITGIGVPAWATLTTTPGNPATAALTLSPPAAMAPVTLGMNFDALDSDTTVPLRGSSNIRVAVVAAAGTPAFGTAPSAVASSASFTFTAGGAVAFQCRLDGGTWTACQSPWRPAGLADGRHTAEVRALNSLGDPSPAAALAWTHDTLAPEAPAILSAPAAATPSTTAQFEFAGEPGGSFECRLDAAAWEACASPQRYAGLAAARHAFKVRQIDAAGNTGAARSFAWEAGGGSAGGRPRTLGVTLPPRATATVHGDTATVGCRVRVGALVRCSTRAYALVSRKGHDGVAVTARAARRVYIGRGIVTSQGGSSRLAVKVKLNATGRRLLARSIGGVRVLLVMNARTTLRTRLATQRRGRFVPKRQVILPANGTFASDSATLTPRGREFLRAVATELRVARSIACGGHTDALGDAAYNLELGRRRAAAACAELRRLGVAGRRTVRSYGSSRPRASNATSRGRELNRRVELTVRWR